MHQSAAISIAIRDDRNAGLSLGESVVTSAPSQPVKNQQRMWMADIEPLTLVIQAVDRSFFGSLIDRRWQCTVELPVEVGLEPAEKAALQYAEQYMHGYLGEDSWVVPQTVQWNEFVPIRSSEDLQRRVASQGPTTSTLQVNSSALQKASGKELIPAATRPYIRRPKPSRPALFLSLSEAASYTGLSEAFLRRKIHDGELQAIRDRSWKLRRADLRNI